MARSSKNTLPKVGTGTTESNSVVPDVRKKMGIIPDSDLPPVLWDKKDFDDFYESVPELALFN